MAVKPPDSYVLSWRAFGHREIQAELSREGRPADIRAPVAENLAPIVLQIAEKFSFPGPS